MNWEMTIKSSLPETLNVAVSHCKNLSLEGEGSPRTPLRVTCARTGHQTPRKVERATHGPQRNGQRSGLVGHKIPLVPRGWLASALVLRIPKVWSNFGLRKG